MNTPRLAVATAVLLMLCGTAGAETMNAKSDPLAVPVSGKSQSGDRAAMPWTEERQAKAQPKLAPQVDPAAVRAASGRFRSGGDVGPVGSTAAFVMVAADTLTGVRSASMGERATNHWTGERLARTQPKLLPVADPAAVSAASERSRSGREAGPQGNTAAVVLAADEYAPIGSHVAPGNDKAGDYWTQKRMRSARPVPMPELGDEDFRKLIQPGKKDR